ncbi:iron export ABC transporter permease subunit FetB [Microseira sp. BLCC-F43]|jgi:putative ABC transport system permease protein|uniref:ABC transporter permease n=1 Tax=Microseira sp. BLCC-F43 TaxID=3153602 RepID=UPI0035B987A7
MDLIQLDIGHLAWALGLIAIAIGLSAIERLGLEWRLLTATVRAIAQLFGVGFVLEVAFAGNNPVAVLVVLILILTTAALVARNRIGKKIPQILPIVWGSLLLSTAFTVGYVNLLVLQPPTWYEPRYLVPLAAIVLGQAMNGAAIAGERLTSSLVAARIEIETHLSLGATPQQAVASYRKEAIRAGIIPTLNSMAIVGVIAFPGFFTGQILGGVSPFQAAFYQMLVLFMVATATLIATLLVTKGVCLKVFNSYDQLIH